ncbi:MAG: Rieske (2Fe-2S) protein [Chitinophagales bacterium]
MERRQFIRSSCNLCLLTASGFLLSELVACNPAYQLIKTEVVNDTIQIPLFSFNQPGLKLVRPNGWAWDIAVYKNAGGYEAILMKCTHQNNQLILTGNGFVCDLQGSNFNLEGIVTKGLAELPLKKFPVDLVLDNLIIYLKSS